MIEGILIKLLPICSSLFVNKEFVLSLVNFDVTTYGSTTPRAAFNINAGQLTLTRCIFNEKSVPTGGAIDVIFEVSTKLYFNVNFSIKGDHMNIN